MDKLDMGGLKELKAAAEAADKEIIRSHGWAGTIEDADLLGIDECYLIEANPAKVLALIAECERLKAENASLRGSCKRMGEDAKRQARLLKKSERERDEARTAHQQELEGHRKTFTQLEQAQREIAQLKGEGQ